MNTEIPLLQASPLAVTPDQGPRHLLGVLFARIQGQAKLPHSHCVLTDHLGFRVDFTCRGVVMAVFFDPDEMTPGSMVRLLCFVENQTSRQRVADFVIGPHAGLGLCEAHRVSLYLAAGQAAVYVLPLLLSSDMEATEHDLPVSLTIRRPSGRGLLLPGVRRRLHNLHHVHFAAPFKVQLGVPGGAVHAANAGANAASLISNPAFLSLASLEDKAPDFSKLEALLSN